MPTMWRSLSSMILSTNKNGKRCGNVFLFAVTYKPAVGLHRIQEYLLRVYSFNVLLDLACKVNVGAMARAIGNNMCFDGITDQGKIANNIQ